MVENFIRNKILVLLLVLAAIPFDISAEGCGLLAKLGVSLTPKKLIE